MSISNQANLEALLFKATNPTNKIEDVNTIKQFCDAVLSMSEGPSVACKLLAHKIQSPQDREAIQALAVLEACVKGCGPPFHSEVGKFKFLNEMIKLVSPKYLGSKTPEHIKKKVIEILYVWTKELKSETKIAEAYEMLKSQGLVKEDPVYVGEAVFAAALPPRQPEPLSEDQSKLLKRLLQSKNPEDLQQANKIIKGMVKEDEKKMDALTRRSTELIMVNNNSKLLNEMLDHYDKTTSGPEELELFKELFDSCEKMQSKLFRLASETDDDDGSIGDILQASDDLARVIDRYKLVIVKGKPDISKPIKKEPSETLLDLGAINKEIKSKQVVDHDDDIIGLLSSSSELSSSHLEAKNIDDTLPPSSKLPVSNPPQQQPLIDDLLNGSLLDTAPPLVINSIPSNLPTGKSSDQKSNFEQKMEEQKSSRQKGLEELDFLGEAELRRHLASKSPQFAKREKLPMNKMQQMTREQDLTPSLPTVNMASANKTVKDDNSDKVDKSLEEVPTAVNDQTVDASAVNNQSTTDFKLSDLNISLQDIKPGSIPPVTLQSEDDGVTIVLNFGRDKPKPRVTAVVITMINKSSSPISDLELKVAVPKGCKVKLQSPSGSSLPAHNPFVPPSAITQVMLILNPEGKKISLKYVLSYIQDGDTQTEMGEAKDLSI